MFDLILNFNSSRGNPDTYFMRSEIKELEFIKDSGSINPCPSCSYANSKDIFIFTLFCTA